MKLGIAAALTWISLVWQPICGAAEVQLEHTFSELQDGGSSWGTDDTLTSAVDLSGDLLPQLFRTPLQRPAPETRSVSGAPVLEKFYLKPGVLKLYRSIRLCVDSRLDVRNASFQTAFGEFARNVAGAPSGELMVDFQWSAVDTSKLRVESLAGCDVLAYQAREGDYPFNRFPPSRGTQNLPEMVLGLYYQYSPRHLPVIAFNPSIELDFSGKGTSYFSPSRDGLRPRVDGRVLFLHELGHLLGFAHVTWVDSITQAVVSTSVMGLKNSLRSEEQVELRYLRGADIWRSWDLRQTSFYRAQLARWLDGSSPVQDEALVRRVNVNLPICAYPGEELRMQLGETQVWSTLAEQLLGISDREITLGAPQERTLKSGSSDTKRSWSYSISPDFEFSATQLRFVQGGPGFQLSSFRFYSQPVSKTNGSYRLQAAVSGKMGSVGGSVPFRWLPALRGPIYTMPFLLNYEFESRARLTDCYQH